MNAHIENEEAQEMYAAAELLRCNFIGCRVPFVESKTVVNFFVMLFCGQKVEKRRVEA